MITILDKSVNLAAMNSSTNPKKAVKHLTIKYGAKCLLTLSGCTLAILKITINKHIAINVLKYKISKMDRGVNVNKYFTAHNNIPYPDAAPNPYISPNKVSN